LRLQTSELPRWARPGIRSSWSSKLCEACILVALLLVPTTQTDST
jgi:hypothetical protein